MKKYDLYIFFLGLITGIFLTVIIAICYNKPVGGISLAHI